MNSTERLPPNCKRGGVVMSTCLRACSATGVWGSRTDSYTRWAVSDATARS